MTADAKALLEGTTPGPLRWGIITQGQSIADEIMADFMERRGGTFGAIMDGQDRFLGFICSAQDTIEEDKANAALWAAAPDLARQVITLTTRAETAEAELRGLCSELDWMIPQVRWPNNLARKAVEDRVARVTTQSSGETTDAKALLEGTTPQDKWEWLYALADCAVIAVRPRGSENLSEYVCLQSEKDASHLVRLLNSLTTRAETAEAEVKRLRANQRRVNRTEDQ